MNAQERIDAKYLQCNLLYNQSYVTCLRKRLQIVNLQSELQLLMAGILDELKHMTRNLNSINMKRKKIVQINKQIIEQQRIIELNQAVHKLAYNEIMAKVSSVMMSYKSINEKYSIIHVNHIVIQSILKNTQLKIIKIQKNLFLAREDISFIRQELQKVVVWEEMIRNKANRMEEEQEVMSQKIDALIIEEEEIRKETNSHSSKKYRSFFTKINRNFCFRILFKIIDLALYIMISIDQMVRYFYMRVWQSLNIKWLYCSVKVGQMGKWP